MRSAKSLECRLASFVVSHIRRTVRRPSGRCWKTVLQSSMSLLWAIHRSTRSSVLSKQICSGSGNARPADEQNPRHQWVLLTTQEAFITWQEKPRRFQLLSESRQISCSLNPRMVLIPTFSRSNWSLRTVATSSWTVICIGSENS